MFGRKLFVGLPIWPKILNMRESACGWCALCRQCLVSGRRILLKVASLWGLMQQQRRHHHVRPT